ncbi:hypothetical protein CC80DRAFT_542410 [Byssothecium circinans]|uniref:Uncharacterized protein n=1 Tax=Byssothecium circinans TaxID=147558 RepID=A0A6A5UAZ6_9PLEO|nr:hypothetical protein CC80DRAFT_542410 [Byssothecium circinans]
MWGNSGITPEGFWRESTPSLSKAGPKSLTANYLDSSSEKQQTFTLTNARHPSPPVTRYLPPNPLLPIPGLTLTHHPTTQPSPNTHSAAYQRARVTLYMALDIIGDYFQLADFCAHVEDGLREYLRDHQSISLWRYAIRSYYCKEDRPPRYVMVLAKLVLGREGAEFRHHDEFDRCVERVEGWAEYLLDSLGRNYGIETKTGLMVGMSAVVCVKNMQL